MNNTQTNTNKQIPITTHDEEILVVKTDILLARHTWQGLHTADMQNYLDLVTKHQEFLPRSLMEQDQRYKQIIPYIIFNYDDSYFMMQRKASASEQRLKNKYTLGIGGHMRREDMLNATSVFDWAKREFHEEVAYSEDFTIKPIGIINDDSTEVGKVHLGLLLLIQGNSDKIAVKSELKSGTLLSVEDMKNYYDQMETWSQIAFEFLTSNSL